MTNQDKEYIVYVYRNEGQCSSAEAQRIYGLDIHADNKYANFCSVKCPLRKSSLYINCMPYNLERQAFKIMTMNQTEFIEVLL